MAELSTIKDAASATEVTVGSVTVRIRYAPVTIQLKSQTPQSTSTHAAPATGPTRTYDSYQIEYYEGSQRKLERRNTPEKARRWAKEIATRLSRLGPQADFLPERERRIYVLGRITARSLGLEVDEVCRRYAELQRRLKEETLEQAVDFKNNHGQRVRDDVVNEELYQIYLADLEKRGVGIYHLRDTKRYVGGIRGEVSGSARPDHHRGY